MFPIKLATVVETLIVATVCGWLVFFRSSWLWHAVTLSIYFILKLLFTASGSGDQRQVISARPARVKVFERPDSSRIVAEPVVTAFSSQIESRQRIALIIMGSDQVVPPILWEPSPSSPIPSLYPSLTHSSANAKSARAPLPPAPFAISYSASVSPRSPPLPSAAASRMVQTQRALRIRDAARSARAVRAAAMVVAPSPTSATTRTAHRSRSDRDPLPSSSSSSTTSRPVAVGASVFDVVVLAPNASHRREWSGWGGGVGRSRLPFPSVPLSRAAASALAKTGAAIAAHEVTIASEARRVSASRAIAGSSASGARGGVGGEAGVGGRRGSCADDGGDGGGGDDRTARSTRRGVSGREGRSSRGNKVSVKVPTRFKEGMVVVATECEPTATALLSAASGRGVFAQVSSGAAESLVALTDGIRGVWGGSGAPPSRTQSAGKVKRSGGGGGGGDGGEGSGPIGSVAGSGDGGVSEGHTAVRTAADEVVVGCAATWPVVKPNLTRLLLQWYGGGGAKVGAVGVDETVDRLIAKAAGLIPAGGVVVSAAAAAPLPRRWEGCGTYADGERNDGTGGMFGAGGMGMGMGMVGGDTQALLRQLQAGGGMGGVVVGGPVPTRVPLARHAAAIVYVRAMAVVVNRGSGGTARGSGPAGGGGSGVDGSLKGRVQILAQMQTPVGAAGVGEGGMDSAGKRGGDPASAGAWAPLLVLLLALQRRAESEAEGVAAEARRAARKSKSLSSRFRARGGGRRARRREDRDSRRRAAAARRGVNRSDSADDLSDDDVTGSGDEDVEDSASESGSTTSTESDGGSESGESDRGGKGGGTAGGATPRHVCVPSVVLLHITPLVVSAGAAKHEHPPGRRGRGSRRAGAGGSTSGDAAADPCSAVEGSPVGGVGDAAAQRCAIVRAVTEDLHEAAALVPPSAPWSAPQFAIVCVDGLPRSMGESGAVASAALQSSTPSSAGAATASAGAEVGRMKSSDAPPMGGSRKTGGGYEGRDAACGEGGEAAPPLAAAEWDDGVPSDWDSEDDAARVVPAVAVGRAASVAHFASSHARAVHTAMKASHKTTSKHRERQSVGRGGGAGQEGGACDVLHAGAASAGLSSSVSPLPSFTQAVCRALSAIAAVSYGAAWERFFRRNQDAAASSPPYQPPFTPPSLTDPSAFDFQQWCTAAAADAQQITECGGSYITARSLYRFIAAVCPSAVFVCGSMSPQSGAAAPLLVVPAVPLSPLSLSVAKRVVACPSYLTSVLPPPIPSSAFEHRVVQAVYTALSPRIGDAGSFVFADVVPAVVVEGCGCGVASEALNHREPSASAASGNVRGTSTSPSFVAPTPFSPSLCGASAWAAVSAVGESAAVGAFSCDDGVFAVDVAATLRDALPSGVESATSPWVTHHTLRSGSSGAPPSSPAHSHSMFLARPSAAALRWVQKSVLQRVLRTRCPSHSVALASAESAARLYAEVFSHPTFVVRVDVAAMVSIAAAVLGAFMVEACDGGSVCGDGAGGEHAEDRVLGGAASAGCKTSTPHSGGAHAACCGLSEADAAYSFCVDAGVCITHVVAPLAAAACGALLLRGAAVVIAVEGAPDTAIETVAGVVGQFLHGIRPTHPPLFVRDHKPVMLTSKTKMDVGSAAGLHGVSTAIVDAVVRAFSSVDDEGSAAGEGVGVDVTYVGAAVHTASQCLRRGRDALLVRSGCLGDLSTSLHGLPGGERGREPTELDVERVVECAVAAVEAVTTPESASVGGGGGSGRGGGNAGGSCPPSPLPSPFRDTFSARATAAAVAGTVGAMFASLRDGATPLPSLLADLVLPTILLCGLVRGELPASLLNLSSCDGGDLSRTDASAAPSGASPAAPMFPSPTFGARAPISVHALTLLLHATTSHLAFSAPPAAADLSSNVASSRHHAHPFPLAREPAAWFAAPLEALGIARSVSCVGGSGVEIDAAVCSVVCGAVRVLCEAPAQVAGGDSATSGLEVRHALRQLVVGYVSTLAEAYVACGLPTLKSWVPLNVLRGDGAAAAMESALRRGSGDAGLETLSAISGDHLSPSAPGLVVDVLTAVLKAGCCAEAVDFDAFQTASAERSTTAMAALRGCSLASSEVVALRARALCGGLVCVGRAPGGTVDTTDVPSADNGSRDGRAGGGVETGGDEADGVEAGLAASGVYVGILVPPTHDEILGSTGTATALLPLPTLLPWAGAAGETVVDYVSCPSVFLQILDDVGVAAAASILHSAVMQSGLLETSVSQFCARRTREAVASGTERLSSATKPASSGGVTSGSSGMSVYQTNWGAFGVHPALSLLSAVAQCGAAVRMRPQETLTALVAVLMGCGGWGWAPAPSRGGMGGGGGGGAGEEAEAAGHEASDGDDVDGDCCSSSTSEVDSEGGSEAEGGEGCDTHAAQRRSRRTWRLRYSSRLLRRGTFGGCLKRPGPPRGSRWVISNLAKRVEGGNAGVQGGRGVAAALPSRTASCEGPVGAHPRQRALVHPFLAHTLLYSVPLAADFSQRRVVKEGGSVWAMPLTSTTLAAHTAQCEDECWAVAGGSAGEGVGASSRHQRAVTQVVCPVPGVVVSCAAGDPSGVRVWAFASLVSIAAQRGGAPYDGGRGGKGPEPLVYVGALPSGGVPIESVYVPEGDAQLVGVPPLGGKEVVVWGDVIAAALSTAIPNASSSSGASSDTFQRIAASSAPSRRLAEAAPSPRPSRHRSGSGADGTRSSARDPSAVPPRTLSLRHAASFAARGFATAPLPGAMGATIVDTAAVLQSWTHDALPLHFTTPSVGKICIGADGVGPCGEVGCGDAVALRGLHVRQLACGAIGTPARRRRVCDVVPTSTHSREAITSTNAVGEESAGDAGGAAVALAGSGRGVGTDVASGAVCSPFTISALEDEDADGNAADPLGLARYFDPSQPPHLREVHGVAAVAGGTRCVAVTSLVDPPRGLAPVGGVYHDKGMADVVMMLADSSFGVETGGVGGRGGMAGGAKASKPSQGAADADEIEEVGEGSSGDEDAESATPLSAAEHPYSIEAFSSSYTCLASFSLIPTLTDAEARCRAQSSVFVGSAACEDGKPCEGCGGAVAAPRPSVSASGLFLDMNGCILLAVGLSNV